MKEGTNQYDVYVSAYKTESKQEAHDLVTVFKDQINHSILKVSHITLNTIIKKITGGYSFNFGKVKNRQIIMIDIDNPNSEIRSHKDILTFYEKFNIKPAAILHSLSSTTSKPRYRCLFILNEKIDNEELYSRYIKLVINIINAYYENSADTKCSVPGSISFPVRNLVYKNEKNIIDVSILNRLLSWEVRQDLHLHFRKFIADTALDNLSLTLSGYKFIMKDQDNKFALSIPSLYSYIRSCKEDNSTLDSINSFELISNPRPHCVSLKDLKIPNSALGKALYGLTNIDAILKSGNLSFLLNKKENIFFNDIFGDTDEAGHSLRCIIKYSEKNNCYYYHRYDMARKLFLKPYDIFNIIQRLFFLPDFKSTYEATCRFCNIVTERQEARIYKKNLTDYFNSLSETSNYKYLNQFFQRDKGFTLKVLEAIIHTFRKATQSFDKPVSANHSIVISQSAICRYLIENKIVNKTYRSNISDKLRALDNLGLIRIVKPEDYTDGQLLQLRNIRITRNGSAKIMVVRLPHYFSQVIYPVANEKAKYYIANQIGSKSMKYEGLRAISSIQGMNTLINILIAKMMRKQYIYLTHLVQYAHQHIWPQYSLKTVRQRINGILPIILQEYGYTKIQATKSNKSWYNFPDYLHYNAKVLIPNFITKKEIKNVRQNYQARFDS